MQLVYGWLCEQGTDRNKNQDAMYFSQGYIEDCHVCLAAACDGVGAYANSDFASQSVASFLHEWFDGFIVTSRPSKKPIKKKAMLLYEQLKNSLREKLWLAHQFVMDESKKRNNAAATTVCVMLVVEGMFCLYNSGDSRAYASGGFMKQLTVDQVAEHNNKSRLTHCLGCFPGPNFMRVEGKIHKHTTYLLATDGFYKNMDVPGAVNTLKKIKTSEEMQKTLYTMRAASLAMGEKDDATVLTLKYI